MPSDIQAAAERREKHKQSSDWKSPYFAEGNMHDVLFSSQKESDAELLADYGVRAATLVPQLVVALKELRKDLPYVIASAEAGGIPDDYAFGFTIRITAGELRSIDAAIAAGEWR